MKCWIIHSHSHSHLNGISMPLYCAVLYSIAHALLKAIEHIVLIWLTDCDSINVMMNTEHWIKWTRINFIGVGGGLKGAECVCIHHFWRLLWSKIEYMNLMRRYHFMIPIHSNANNAVLNTHIFRWHNGNADAAAFAAEINEIKWNEC